MNAYTTIGQARIQTHDIAAVMRAYPLVGASLAALERERGWQAEAEVDWLLRKNGVTPPPSSSRVSTLRQTIGAVLIRAGARLAGVAASGDALETAPVGGTLGTTA